MAYTLGKTVTTADYWSKVAAAAPKDWQGDPRHYPKTPDPVDLVRVDAKGVVSGVVLSGVMPYEVVDYVALRCPQYDGVRYEVAAVGAYKAGDTWSA